MILTPSEANSAELRVYSAADQKETWQLNVTGTMRLAADQVSDAPLPDLAIHVFGPQHAA